MKNHPLKTGLIAAVFAGGALFSAPRSARATTMYKASVVSWHTSLMVLRGGRMVPVMTVNQGASLQVSDTTQNGWRQVLIRQPGQGARWGWVADGEVLVSGETLPLRGLPPLPKNQSVTSGGGGGVTQHPPGRVVVSARAGYLLPVGASGGLTYGGDIGYRLLDGHLGRLYLGLQASLGTASSSPLGFAGNATFTTIQVGVTERNLLGSDFYAGVMAGFTIIGVSVGPLSATTLQYSMTGTAGYDFRVGSVFSFGPEVGFTDIALGGYDAIQLLLAGRIHL